MSGPAIVILLAGLGYVATVVAVVGSVIRTDAEIELREQPDDLMAVADAVQEPSRDELIAAEITDCDFRLWQYENGWEVAE